MAKFSIIESINDLKSLTKELSTRLRALTFTDNFSSFELDLTIAATTEVANIRNQLTFTPTRVINLGQTGNGLITKGDTAWDGNYLSIKNHGSVEVIVKLLFIR